MSSSISNDKLRLIVYEAVSTTKVLINYKTEGTAVVIGFKYLRHIMCCCSMSLYLLVKVHIAFAAIVSHSLENAGAYGSHIGRFEQPLITKNHIAISG